MMTIKELATLCGCNTQTLRYYDKIDLLKPVKVDQWSGYRYYTKAQAIAFVKIKNLQAADFTIDEIKALQECGADTLALMLWKHQNILHEYDGMPIANGTNDA